MTDWLFEDPTIVVGISVLLTGVLAFLYFQTREKIWLIGTIGTLVIGGILVGIEHFVVTVKEVVIADVDQLTIDLESNNIESVISHLSDEIGPEQLLVARTSLNMAEITNANVSDLDITPHPQNSPPTAEAEFVGTIQGTYKGRSMEAPGVLRKRFILYYRYYPGKDRWQIYKYEMKALNDHSHSARSEP